MKTVLEALMTFVAELNIAEQIMFDDEAQEQQLSQLLNDARVVLAKEGAV